MLPTAARIHETRHYRMAISDRIPQCGSTVAMARQRHLQGAAGVLVAPQTSEPEARQLRPQLGVICELRVTRSPRFDAPGLAVTGDVHVEPELGWSSVERAIDDA